MNSITPEHLKSYVCVHVFDGARPVLYVTRPDGDWCFLCGEDHPEAASQFRVVGMGHVLKQDATLAAVMDLGVDEEAERTTVGAEWTRAAF